MCDPAKLSPAMPSRSFTSTPPPPASGGVTVRCRVRRSPRLIDPEFGPCREALCAFLGPGEGPSALATPRSSPPPPADASLLLTPVGPGVSRGRVSIGIGLPRVSSSPVRFPSQTPAYAGGTLRQFGGSPLPVPPPTAPAGGGRRSAGNVLPSGRRASTADDAEERVGEGRETIGDGAKEGTAGGGGSSSVFSFSRMSSGASSSQSQHSLTRVRSRSRSRGRKGQSRYSRYNRSGSIGAASAFADAEIPVNGLSPGGETLRGSGPPATPHQQQGGGEADAFQEPYSVPLKDVASVDQDVIHFPRTTSGDATASALPLPPPGDSNACARHFSGKAALYRIFLHTSSNGYLEFSFDNTNSHDVLLAYLWANLPADRFPDNAARDKDGDRGAYKTLVLAPSASSSRRSRAEESAPASLEKFQARAMRRRVREESTALERIREGAAQWMSVLADCACCAGAAAAVSPCNVDETVRTGDSLKGRGVGSLWFEESVQLQAKLTPRLSFEHVESSPRRRSTPKRR